MDKKIKQVLEELKKTIMQKYDLQDFRIFGSTARNDRKNESDIDVYIRIPKLNRKIEENLFDLAYEIELKYDCVIDLFIFDNSVQKGINNSIPVYQNILKEGLAI